MAVTDQESSPVFVQFVDCVWQLLREYPGSFGFNELFLVLLLRHVYSCRFGTFLANSESESRAMRLPAITASVWSVLNPEVSWQCVTSTASLGRIMNVPENSVRQSNLQLFEAYFFNKFGIHEAESLLVIP